MDQFIIFFFIFYGNMICFILGTCMGLSLKKYRSLPNIPTIEPLGPPKKTAMVNTYYKDEQKNKE